MVVSKDSKRKRKESSPPATPQQQSSTAVESSPEMPKRTKVQAQRKFAQGQSAPQSSYSSIIAASSSSNTGPSTSSECREPPTEILPNKRPKTEDFLTFLCFRGSSALPPHLDFLNQGKNKEPERPVKKPTVKPVIKKKGKKGRPPKNAKQKEENMSTSKEECEVNKNDVETSQENQNDINKTDGKDKNFEKVQVEVRKDGEGGEGKGDVEGEEEEDDDVPSFAVRKRAEVVADGNRRGNRSNADEKCNNSMETSKRRSNRASTKGSKVMLDHLSDEEDDEYFSAVDENSKALNSDIDNKERKNTKTPVNSERKSETPSKESETTGKSRKGRPASTNKKKEIENSNNKEIERDESVKSDIKEKAPAKRQRQKESPIFIPSPEPSGRMTRQRAFFEPVKVPHKDNDDDDVKNDIKKDVGGETQVEIKSDAIEKADENPNVKNEENNEKIPASLINDDKNKPTQLDVFDFSSDDEQPLAKAIKLKKSGTNKSSPKKTNPRGKKSSPKKESTEESIKKADKEEIKVEQADDVKKESTTMENVMPATEDDSLKTKGKRSSGQSTKYSKKKEHDESLNETDKESIAHSPKKQSNVRQSRKKNKTDNNENVAGETETDDNQGSPTRNQRPSRKTKEAATIYMGIIGHRLQMAEDDDDDISLSSFDRPNVREMEKMENELKRNSASAGKGSPPPKQAKSSDMPEPPSIPVSTAAPAESKPTTGRRGRPPKNPKIQAAVPLPKREIEGMLVKKGAIAKLTQSTENLAETKDSKTEPSKAGTEDDEDFLLNEELNETKRKLEKSFSDSDDEPLAIKAHVKSSDKDGEESRKSAGGGGVGGGECISPLAVPSTVANPPTTIGGLNSLSMLPITTKSIATTTTTSNQTQLIPISQTTPVTTCIPTTALATPPAISAPIATTPSPISCNIQPPAPVTPTSQSPFKSIEKKSPVPTSKILNVPATYGIPPASPTGNIAGGINTNFGKSPMYVPQSPAHYHSPHSSHIRPTTSMQQFPVQSVKNPSLVAPPSNTVTSHLTTPPLQITAQSPIKYQTPPTTYPPPIEAYPSPKINPNFLTPKFDRNTLSRPGNNTGNNNSFPSPSPVKFDMSGSSSGLLKNSSLSAPNVTMSPKTLLSSNMNFMGNNPTTSTSAAGQVVNDPLKDEIGSILAANLMPSKEESGKIFGIASVSLAQSSGPDNTKCTLGKCGSIHKPVLGPVVPTESYIGDQLSGKERRKAKVNMTHEQIHKWLIECSSNPDEIQDDLDDDFDSDLRPNNFGSTPPPTRDDKESTSFSSSSKATRDLGKSESAWSAKGPSLKATPVVATTSAINNRKEDVKPIEPTSPRMDEEMEKNSPVMNMIFDKTPVNKQSPAPGSLDEKITQSDKSEKKSDKKGKEDKISTKTVPNETKHSKSVEKEVSTTTNKTSTIGKQNSNQKSLNQKKTTPSPVTTPTTSNTNNKQNRKKTAPEAVEEKTVNANQKESVNPPDVGNSNSTSNSVNRTPKRTPVYQQKQTSKQQQQQSQQQENTDLKISTTTSHKRTSTAYGTAFSVENEKSIYSFDKDDAEDQEKSNKPSTYRRQSRKDSSVDNNGVNTPTTTVQRTPPTKPKRNAAAVAEIANKELAGGNSQTSSVSLTLSPSEKTKLVKVSLDGDTKTTKSTKGGKGGKKNNQNEAAKVPVNDAESDSGDGHTFYIPLQGIGAGGDGDGGIQGVAVKLGREGPDGPNQKVIMHATLVTKAQMGSNTKPLPDTMNVSDIVKNLMTSDKKGSGASTSAAAAAATNSCSNSMKNVPIGTVQPRFKGDSTAQGPSTSSAGGGGGGGGLQRVNSNSSLFSGSVKSRNAAAAAGASGSGATAHGSNKKFKDDTPIKMANNTAFPRHDDPTQMVEAPIFRPSEKEFADPIEFIERITPIAARFGICKIIPPASFKPECRISDEMRFTAYNQYVHKLLHRWGPSAKELSAIKKYLTTQSIVMNHPPWIGGMEVDLPRLYHTVQELGGLKEVIEKKKWARVAEEMCIPKLAQDRVTKLDDIYCKYLLPYDTLSPAERQKLFDEVEADWAKREARARRNADRFVNTESVSNEEDDVSSENDEEESEEEVDGVSMECIVKGRSMPLSQFYRIARNTMALWFKNTEPTVNEVEAEFWRHVAVRDSHVCVHSGSIDSSGWGFGFPSPGPKGKGSNYARHPWNLKVLTNNTGSVLRSLGPVMGVTVPTLHVGMLFSACCWYRDPHGLSWIEYLHTGASKLWYGIPDDQSANFRAALTSLIPTHCQNKTIWLPCDTVMVPPHMLTDRGVSLCRIEQKPGEFIVVFPRAYTSSLATGYVVSESVYFATSSWLDLAKDDFRDIHDSCEPAMFSLEQLLFALGYDQRVTPDTLQQMLPMLQEVYEKETAAREQLKAAGVTSTEKVGNEKSGKGKKQQQPPHKSIESECDLCRANLYISMVRTDEGNVYCLQHALKNLNNGNIQAKQCKLIYAYNIDDIENLIKNLKDRIQQKRAVTGKKQK